MSQQKVDLNKIEVKIHDPLAEYLGGPDKVTTFSVSIVDAARLAGHLCPSVAGAFLATRAAVEVLFPDTKTCIRGLLEVDLSGAPHEGATGPIGHVISYITGAWSTDGFGGLDGQFRRRDLLRFSSKRCKRGAYRFERTDTGQVVHVYYRPGKAELPELDDGDRFAESWQARVRAILASPAVIEIESE